jgi:hypothetical protein
MKKSTLKSMPKKWWKAWKNDTKMRRFFKKNIRKIGCVRKKSRLFWKRCMYGNHMNRAVECVSPWVLRKIKKSKK